jgi:RNA polymerase sigma-70 factor (ECF subfamily)
MRPDDMARIATDTAAFETFYREHVEAVQRSIARRVENPHLAADLTADVFLAAIDAAPSYRADRGSPPAWLFGIARVVIAAERRRSARERSANARVAGRRLLDEDDIARMQARIDAAARARELYAALDDLPDGERAVFELVALDGASVKDVAAVLGIRAVTARVRLHRARAALRRQIFDDDSSTVSRPLEAA